jgi:hypothetical protein
MNETGKLFVGGAVLFVLIAGLYWVMSHDEVGTTGLVLTGALSGMIGFYLMITARRMDPQPSDLLDGEIWQADPDYGHYSPHSWAPLMAGASAAIVFLGLALAAWIMLAGLVLLVMSAAYRVFEYYRGPGAQF